MSNHTAWSTLRDEFVERAGGEAVVEATKREILAEITGQRLAEIRSSPGMTQQQIVDRMQVHPGPVGGLCDRSRPDRLDLDRPGHEPRRRP